MPDKTEAMSMNTSASTRTNGLSSSVNGSRDSRSKYDLIDWIICMESPRRFRALLMVILGVATALWLLSRSFGSVRVHELELPPSDGIASLIGDVEVARAKGATLTILSELKVADNKGLDSAAALADLRIVRSSEF